jgi:hypothetical protein
MGLEPLLLASWGAIVSLDERGVLFGGLAHPLVAGAAAGVLVGEPAIGIWSGFLFQAVWPVRLESGGNIPPAGGLAAVGATGVAVSLGAPSLPGVASWPDTSQHGAFWIAVVILGLAIALAARAWERSMRLRNGARAGKGYARGEEGLAISMRAALAEAALRGGVLVGVPALLAAWLRGSLAGRSPAQSGWLDGAAVWLLPAFLALGLGNLAWALRRPLRAAWLDWTVGVTVGAGSALLLERLR